MRISSLLETHSSAAHKGAENQGQRCPWSQHGLFFLSGYRPTRNGAQYQKCKLWASLTGQQRGSFRYGGSIPRARDVMGAGGEPTPPLHSESIVPKSTLNIRLTPTERNNLHSSARNISRQQTETNTENHNQQKQSCEARSQGTQSRKHSCT